MVEDKINSTAELYIKVRPALRSKKKELTMKKLGFISEKNIWDYLVKNKWNKEKSLTLFDIVNDILMVDEAKLLNYLTNMKRGE